MFNIFNGYDDDGKLTQTGYDAMDFNYLYDDNDQLVRTDNDFFDYTSAYIYDDRGNITARNVYEFTKESLDEKTPTSSTTFTYAENGWKDQLTAVNGVPLTYDENGNVLTYGDKSYTWNTGRNLESITDGENTYSYTYDENGIRTSKTVNGVTTYYNTQDGVILSQTDGINTMYFQYDTNGMPLGFIYNGTQYLYVTNQMGDVICITDENGTELAMYVYDDWGALEGAFSAHGEDWEVALAQANPIRYRGYYFDTETGYYYLQSRYYAPNICRFINADDNTIPRVSRTIYFGNNLFAYCFNNPINKADSSGFVVETIVDVASIGWSLYSFIKAPSWLNFGYLAWDTASAFIPFVPGSYVAKGGKLAVKVASKVSDLKSAKYLQIGKYDHLRKLFKGVKGIEVHHIIEKRFQKALFKNTKPGNFMSIPLTKELHQEITKRWRKEIGYGLNYKNISYAQMERAIKNVYKDMPELKKQALKWLKQNWKK